MPRTVVHDSPLVQQHYAALIDAELAGRGGASSRRRRVSTREAIRLRKTAQQDASSGTAVQGAAAPTVGADDYLSKLVKYVPAETIAIVTLGFGVFGPEGNWVWFWLCLAAAANVVYLSATALALPQTAPRPRVYLYVLSALAFLAWAVATVPAARTAAHISGANANQRAGFVLAAAAFLIPALDTIFAWAELHFRGDAVAASGS